MEKKLDVASNKNNKKRNTNVIDLRESIKKDSLVINNNKNLEDKQKEEKIKNEINEEIKISPKLKNQKKIQPIWWTIEEKRSFNSKFSIIFFILITIFFIVSVVQKNWTFSVILVLATVLFIFYFLKPQKNLYRLTNEGFYIDESFYPYDDVKYFGILKTANKDFIIFETDRILNKHIYLPLKNDKTDKVEEFLTVFLTEKEIKPTLIDLLANIF